MAVRGLACERGPESSIAPSATTLQPHYCTTPPLYYLLPMHAQDWFLAIVAILLPPVAVAIKRGICSADFLINVALSILGFIPGLIHAFWIIASYPYDEQKKTHYVAPQQSYGSIN